ncbi:MAG: hypothetical protein Q9192_006010 [Flavoplaca navasiana]
MYPKTTTKQFGKRCDKLFLSLLYSLPKPGTVTNPIDLDRSQITITSRQHTRNLTMATEGKASAGWSDAEERILLLHILVEQNVKIEYEAVSDKLNRSVSAIKQHITKMKNDYKKANTNLAGSEDTAAVAAAVTPCSKPAKRRSPKQKGAIETPTSSNANDNDFAAGYGSDGEIRTENSTPSKTATKKSRTSRKAKDDADGEPAFKKQKTSKDAKSIKAASSEEFTRQLVTAASPVKHELVKMETGSQSGTEVEDKGQLENMEEDVDAEHDEEGDQGSHFGDAMYGTD